MKNFHSKKIFNKTDHTTPTCQDLRMNLRGPQCLGRSVVVSPQQPAPSEWLNMQRITNADIELLRTPSTAGETILGTLRMAWLNRQALVIECDNPFDISAPIVDHFWDLDPLTEPYLEQAQFFIFANAVDLRDSTHPRFLPWDLAKRAGASRSTVADIISPQGEHLWIDGGPLQVLTHDDLHNIGVVPRVHLHLRHFTALHPAVKDSAQLAPDQLAAVQHVSGPARIIAPAGSGKTRVLTERVRHLVDQGVSPTAITMVTYNVRAQDEIKSRLFDIPQVSVKTLHALAREVLQIKLTRGAVPDLINEIEIRRLLASLAPHQKARANTDSTEPWVDAIAFARDTLSSPAEVETVFPDISDFRSVIVRYRQYLESRDVIDFPEMILSACEALLDDSQLRDQVRQRVGLLLVDEFQDLTPLLMLFVRLLAGPAQEIFCVGDDDQTIYGFSGATPQWLVDFSHYFPGSTNYALTVNYRCPDAVVTAASRLLDNNVNRIAKNIACAPHQQGTTGLTYVASLSPDHELLQNISTSITNGVSPRDIAVLARVNASLLGPYLFLSGSQIPCQRPQSVNEDILSRGGVASLLAWVDIATSARRSLDANSLTLALKRPKCYVSPKILEILQSKTDLASIGRFVETNKNEKMRDDLVEFVAHGLHLQALVKKGTTTAALIDHILDVVGLAESLSDLDNSQRVARKASHRDELESFREIAVLESDPHKFRAFVQGALSQGVHDPSGVTLETIHRIKGQEWPEVHVVGAVDGQLPHRLSVDVEEERRIFHVAVTRCSKSVTIYSNSDETLSPFVNELEGLPSTAVTARIPQTAKPATMRKPKPEITEYDTALFDALRAWRSQVSTLTAKPAFTVFSDATLKELAAVKPRTERDLGAINGIGPAKLDQYSLVLLGIIEKF